MVCIEERILVQPLPTWAEPPGLHQHFLFLPESPPGHQGEIPAGGVAGHLRGQLGGVHALLVLLRALPRPRLPDDNREWWPVAPAATLVPVWGAGVSGAAGPRFPPLQTPCGALQPGRQCWGSILHESWALPAAASPAPSPASRGARSGRGDLILPGRRRNNLMRCRREAGQGRPGRRGQINVCGDEVAMSEQDLQAGRASRQPLPRAPQSQRKKGEQPACGHLSVTADVPYSKHQPAWRADPLWELGLGAFCPCLGFAVGCSLLPTAPPGPVAKRGPPGTAVCAPWQGSRSPSQLRRGGGCQALAENASFINPSAEKGGRNCHNNSDDRLI